MKTKDELDPVKKMEIAIMARYHKYPVDQLAQRFDISVEDAQTIIVEYKDEDDDDAGRHDKVTNHKVKRIVNDALDSVKVPKEGILLTSASDVAKIHALRTDLKEKDDAKTQIGTLNIVQIVEAVDADIRKGTKRSNCETSDSVISAATPVTVQVR